MTTVAANTVHAIQMKQTILQILDIVRGLEHIKHKRLLPLIRKKKTSFSEKSIQVEYQST